MTLGSGLFTKKGPKVPHLSLLGAKGLEGEVADLREDVRTSFLAMAAITVEEFVNPVAASPNAIKLAIASVAAIVSYSGAQLDGAVGGAVMSPPRNLTITTAGGTAADAPATATITGVDVNGAVISETITVAQTATIALGVKAFAKVTKIDLPAADGTGATLAFGFGSVIGLGKKIKSRAGLAFVLKEAANGAVVTNGTIVAAATGLPNGTYAPNTIPDGAKTYAIFYEYDPTV
jgi:hypothetical protein